MSGRFQVRPHLSAALLSRLISGVLARLLSALDDGQLEDCDLVALALAVGQSAFTAEVTGGKSQSERRSSSGADRRPESSLVASQQVIWPFWRD